MRTAHQKVLAKLGAGELVTVRDVKALERQLSATLPHLPEYASMARLLGKVRRWAYLPDPWFIRVAQALYRVSFRIARFVRV